MMKRKPTQYDFQSFLYNIGFRWWEDGQMKNGNKKYGVYWKGDKISDEQKQQLKDKFGKWVEFYKAQAQYAPEQIKPIVLLRSAN
jgi:hypothetical protein